MDIIISTSSREPYYAQISRQIQQQILSGQLHPGDALPTIRSLAKTLRVSVITVQHAYEDLQRNGFLETTVGRGTFVTSRDVDLMREEARRQVRALLDQAVALACDHSLSAEELAALWQQATETGGSHA